MKLKLAGARPLPVLHPPLTDRELMLKAFIVDNRGILLEMARARVAERVIPPPSKNELEHGIPVFLDQLCDALELAASSDEVDHREMSKSAGLHGLDLFRMGLTIGQVVHDYGDVCQVVTTLAMERRAPIPPAEFRVLNLCLDDAIAEAVTEYARQSARKMKHASTERLGVLAHEMRNLLNSSFLAFDLIKQGRVGADGSTGKLLGRSLTGLRDLVDRSLATVRLDAGVKQFKPVGLAEFIDELCVAPFIQARMLELRLTLTPIDPTLFIEADRAILASALSNLLQNAFKFTRPKSCVSLRVSLTVDRVVFEVEDECGGLPGGVVDDIFRPFAQHGLDRSGVGLGLAICRGAAESHGGELRVRDLPGVGCLFSLDLPRVH